MSWTIESYEECFSDFYKEVHGVRPRFDTSNWSLEQWQNEFNGLRRVSEMNAEREAASRAAALQQLEEDITKLIAMGAQDRATAIRWIVGDDDPDYACYERGLPNGTLGNKRRVVPC